MVGDPPPTKRVAWAADPGAPERTWHVTLMPDARPLPTFCGVQLTSPAVIRDAEPGVGGICFSCAATVQRLAHKGSDEEIPHRYLTTLVWEVERDDGGRERLNRADALDAFADAALQERGPVQLIADGVIYQRAWMGPHGQLFHSVLRNDGSSVELAGDAARAALKSLIAHRAIGGSRGPSTSN